ncbi:hypothetical protein EV363DRAFT_1458241 [Boletus edulis]|nr:hypothetical protein EV363DRAFT_1458241 [Boletus edulis]
MSPLHIRRKSERPPHLMCCSPSSPIGPEFTEFSPSRELVPKPSKAFLSIPQFLKPNRSTKAHATSIHRALLVSEILWLILDYICRFDESPESDHKWDRTMGKRTLASLARTCRTLSKPALDALWMRLDNLDPLIKVLPRRMWAKKHYPFVVRMFMGEKQWETFHKYAVRVRFVRGPCWRVPAAVQHNVIAALARYPKASLPLLPNLTELIWSELKMSNLIDPSVSLIKYFAGPGVTTVSLFLICWPNHVSSELAVLADLPNLCPNVTSFTAFFPRSSYSDHSREIGDIVRQWPQLRVLRSCALSQPVMDTITTRKTLDTLSIELNNSSTAVYVGQLPSHVHTWSLGGNSAGLCLRYLETIQGSPTSFHLRIGADDSTTADMEALVGVLPTRLDKNRLHTLAIELTSSYWSTPASDTFSLSSSLLSSLASFPSLRELDISTYCAAEVDDQGYTTWIAALKGLTSLKVGVADVSKARPFASVGAVLAVLRACRQLETLWIVFDGTLGLPSVDEKGKRRGQLNKVEKIDGSENKNEWGVTNHLITHIRVGHSPLGEDEKGLEAMARCLRSVMPRLEKIRSDKYPSEVEQRWARVQGTLAKR